MLTVPHALVEVRRRYSDAQEVALIDAVHAALVQSFRIPAEDKHVRPIAHEPHRFAVPPTLTDPASFTLISSSGKRASTG